MQKIIQILQNSSPNSGIINNPKKEDEINFNKAINADDKSCFSLSGSKKILECIQEWLGYNTSIMVDFSAIPSSFMNNKKLADFITVYDPNSVFTDQLDNAYNIVYRSLADQKLGIFYREDFFQIPKSPSFYYSIYSETNLIKNIEKQYHVKPEKWPRINDFTKLFFKNKSISLSYKRFEEIAKQNTNVLINCQTRNQILLQFYNKYFLNDNSRYEKKKLAHLLSIPLIGYPGKENNDESHFEGLGAIFVYFIKDFGPDGIDEDILKQHANDLWFLGLQITYNPVFQIAHQLFDTAREEATKAAKAAIMSRNMSHNLGSHVMSYLKMHLGSVSNILKDHVLSTLLESEDLDTLKNHALVADKLTLPFLVGIGRFISYLQERQDFIATVSTNFVPYYSSVSFKDFIFDELNCDKRYDRHPKRTNQKPDNSLLGNIARSEGLGRQTSPTQGDSTLNDIVLKFRTTFDGSPTKHIDTDSRTIKSINPLDHYGDNNRIIIAAKELEEMRPYELSLPGGIIGRQAIFSIIENIIRNAAKHGNWREQENLELTIDIFTKEDVDNNQPDDYLRKRLRDDDQANNQSLSLKGVLQKFYCKNEDPKKMKESNESPKVEDYYKKHKESTEPKASRNSGSDFFFITLTDNLNYTSDSLKSLRKALIEDYIDEDGRMISANKGIKEMRISAAWLRSIIDDIALSPFYESNLDIEEKPWMDDNNHWIKQPPVLYARRSKNAITGACNLQYIFCVLRPKKVAFISTAFEKNNDGLQRKGWQFLSPHKYLDINNKNYEFVIYDDTEDGQSENNFNKIRRQSSQRFIKLSDLNKSFDSFERIKTNPYIDIEKNKDIDKEKNQKDIFDIAYVQLYNHLSKGNHTGNIYIIDDTTCENNIIDKQQNSENQDDSKAQVYEKIILKKSYPTGKIVKYGYLFHLEDKEKFLEYVINKDLDQETDSFLEGISGDNSTDRLVRNEPLTDLWFYKHLYAMEQTIAIFDERIFSKVYGLDEADFVNTKETFWGNDVNTDIEYLKAMYLDIKDQNWLDDIKNREDLNSFLKSKVNFKKPNCSDLAKKDARNYLGATYKYKKLFIFSIIRSVENPKRFNIFGVKIDKEAKPAFSHCVRYATLSWDSYKKRLIVNHDKDQQMNWILFDSLSIHQGLLDKLYACFGIEKNDIEAKENLTKDFYESFIIDTSAKTIVFTDENNNQHYFLPGMTIHSGRSKPSKEDMPQRLPFIPYSAIEHAVLDCKYSIVELLDSARYE